MTITVNGQPENIPDTATVSDLLAHLQLDGSPCAVEINKTLIPKRRHQDQPLAPGDIVEIVTLVGGG
ncbi:MAG: sulfur carrier protein ThiS [Phycisphaerae bacterium]|nr:sulfur carrier protein ThiS [Phycisphaerae bacterium]